MLQVHYKRPDDVIIYGVFYGVFTSGRKFVLALGKGQKTYPLSYTTPRIPGVSRIFKYPSSLHPGELAE
jgi:hypothetical protein